MKNIRELRMGPPKTFKTGSVVNTYPKPMLVFEGDEGGLDVVPKIDLWVDASTDTSNDISARCELPRGEQPPITAIMFNVKASPSLDNLFTPTADVKSFPNFNKTFNNLFLKGCPWKTVVVDPVTVVQDMILSSFAGTNPSKMEDAQKWAGAVGEKVKRVLSTIFTLPCHVVVIMHTAQKDIIDPVSRQVKESYQEPVIYGRVRNFIGSLPSQFFYQDCMTVGGKVQSHLQTVADGKVKGVGARWPSPLAAKIGTSFLDIYGESVKKGETWM